MRSLQALSKSSKKSLKVLGAGPKDTNSVASDQLSANSINDFELIVSAPPVELHDGRRQDKVKRAGALHSVRILGDRFQPPYLRVRQGDYVMWSLEMAGRSASEKDMHVVSFEQLGEDSELMRTEDDKFEMKFADLGTFEYRCGIRARMTGIVEVIGVDSLETGQMADKFP